MFTAWLSDVEQWKYGYLYGSLVEFLLFFHLYGSGTVLTVLTAVKVLVDILMLWCCITPHSTGMLLSFLGAKAQRAAKWLLSSAAREMHTCTLASYVITREGCTAHCSWLTICLAWVEKFILGLYFSLGILFYSFVWEKFHKGKET